MVWSQFEKQKSRGIDGFGVFDGNHIFKTPKLKKMRGWMRNNRNDSNFLMFHHRWPTSTVNVARAAHPFSTGEYFGKTQYILIHNGTITNNKALHENHKKLGIRYSSTLDNGSFNDSEALLWDMALYLEGKQEKLESYGGIAFVCAKLVDDKITNLYFGRNFGRPLHMYKEREGLILSSEGVGEDITEHTLYTYNWDAHRVTKKALRIPSFDPSYSWDNNSYNRPKYQPALAPALPKPKTNYPVPYDRRYSGSYSGQDILDPVDYTNWEEDRELYIPKEGVDYYIDDNDEIVYFESDDEYEDWKERKRINDAKEDTDSDAYIQAYEHQWWLSSYANINRYQGVSSSDIKAWTVYGTYMREYDGYYQAAMDGMDTDLAYFINHQSTPLQHLVVSALEEAMELFTIQREFVSANSYDPGFSRNEDEVSSKKVTKQIAMALLRAGEGA